MFVSFGLKASAEEAKPYIDVSTELELIIALQTLDAMDYAYINVIDDIVVTSTIKIGKAYFKLNGNSITAETAIILAVDEKLILDGDNGSLRITGPRKRGNPAITAQYKANVKISNTTICGGDGEVTGGQGIIAYGPNIIMLDNCNISSGNSANDQFSNSAVFLFVSEIYINDCHFSRGTGIATNNYALIEFYDTCFAYDFDSNPITVPDYKTSIISYGKSITKETSSMIVATTTIPAPTYTVTIPDTFDFGNQKQALAKYADKENDQYGDAINVSVPFSVIATDVKNLFNDLDDGKSDYINVTVDFDGKLKGTNNIVNEVPFTLSQDGTELVTGNKIATFYNDVDLASKGKTNSADVTITINRCDIRNADSYSGTLTFTIGIAHRANG